MVQQATSTGNEADIRCCLQKEELGKLRGGKGSLPPRVECHRIRAGQPPFPTWRRRGSKGFFGSGAHLGKNNSLSYVALSFLLSENEWP